MHESINEEYGQIDKRGLYSPKNKAFESLAVLNNCNLSFTLSMILHIVLFGLPPLNQSSC